MIEMPLVELSDCGDPLERTADSKFDDTAVRGLVDALLAVSAELNIEAAVRAVVGHAATVVGAEHAVLAIAGDSGDFVRFVYDGICGYGVVTVDPVAPDSVAHQSRSHVWIDRRPDDLDRSHASSYRSVCQPSRWTILEFAVHVEACEFGRLYLSGPAGKQVFTDQDAMFAQALAAAAGKAIANSRRYEGATFNQDQLQATSEIATALLGDLDADAGLQMITDRSLELTGSICAFLAIPETHEVRTSGKGDLVVEVVSGDGTAELVGQSIPLLGTTIGQAITATGQSFLSTEPVIAEHLSLGLGIDNSRHYGAAMALPLRDQNQVLGVLTVLKAESEGPFSNRQLSMMSAFADQAAVAWQLADSRRQGYKLNLLSDRDRIARDLHDHVIQRVFAVGLSVQGTLQRAQSVEVRSRLRRTVNDLQEIIQDIRRTIFDLHNAGTTGLQTRLHAIVADATADTDLHVALHVRGPISVVESELAGHVEAVLREALSNVVRHAAATEVSIELRVDDYLSVAVDDDGRGLSKDISWRGLGNLADRAAELGGTFSIRDGVEAGVNLVWEVPIP